MTSPAGVTGLRVVVKVAGAAVKDECAGEKRTQTLVFESVALTTTVRDCTNMVLAQLNGTAVKEHEEMQVTMIAAGRKLGETEQLGSLGQDSLQLLAIFTQRPHEDAAQSLLQKAWGIRDAARLMAQCVETLCFNNCVLDRQCVAYRFIILFNILISVLFTILLGILSSILFSSLTSCSNMPLNVLDQHCLGTSAWIISMPSSAA